MLFFTFNHSGFLQMRCIRAVGHHKRSSSSIVISSPHRQRRGDNESLEASDGRSSGRPRCLRVRAEGATIGAAAHSRCHAEPCVHVWGECGFCVQPTQQIIEAAGWWKTWKRKANWKCFCVLRKLTGAVRFQDSWLSGTILSVKLI